MRTAPAWTRTRTRLNEEEQTLHVHLFLCDVSIKVVNAESASLSRA